MISIWHRLLQYKVLWDVGCKCWYFTANCHPRGLNSPTSKTSQIEQIETTNPVLYITVYNCIYAVQYIYSNAYIQFAQCGRTSSEHLSVLECINSCSVSTSKSHKVCLSLCVSFLFTHKAVHSKSFLLEPPQSPEVLKMCRAEVGEWGGGALASYPVGFSFSLSALLGAWWWRLDWETGGREIFF